MSTCFVCNFKMSDNYLNSRSVLPVIYVNDNGLLIPLFYLTVTSGLQTTDATLVGNELFVNCVFAVGSISTGCRVIAYNVNGHELVNETIERNVTKTAANGSTVITDITSDIYIVVYVFDVNDVNIKWILIPTVVPVTTTTVTVYISSKL